MRAPVIYPLIFLLILFNSCTIEDEIIDLTHQNNVLIETTVYFTEDTENYDVSFTYFETDGYNNLINKFRGYSGDLRGNKQVFYHTVKEYKKAGLKIIPGEKVTEVWINLIELGAGKNIFHQFISRDNKGFTFLYDFETESHEVTWE
ncbi:MAG: hypothetical protein R6W85_05680 [Gillisia sp.]